MKVKSIKQGKFDEASQGQFTDSENVTIFQYVAEHSDSSLIVVTRLSAISR